MSISPFYSIIFSRNKAAALWTGGQGLCRYDTIEGNEENSGRQPAFGLLASKPHRADR
jgi:hypothetical protein